MNPTPPRPTDAAIALVREALHSGVLMHAAAPDDVIKTRAPGFSVDGALMRDRLVEGLLAHPTLARVIAIGQAWVAAEVAAEASIPPDLDNRMPEGKALIEVGGYSWGDSAFFAHTCRPAAWASVKGPSPEAALQALAAALTDQERGS